MLIRNGVLTTLRARRRSLLFGLLIAVLTIALALGAGMWTYSSRMLDRCEEIYTSIVLAEYIGAEYPNGDVADKFSRDALAELESGNPAPGQLPGVKRWETTDAALVQVDGFARKVGEVPYSGSCVLVLDHFTPMYQEGMGVIDPAEIPTDAKHAITNMDTGVTTLYSEHGQALELPLIYYDGETELCWQERLKDGQKEKVYLENEELPDVFMLLETGAWWPTQHGIVPKPFRNITADQNYQYNPATGEYLGVTQVAYAYSTQVSQVLYAKQEKVGPWVLVEGGSFTPEEGKQYLVNGVFKNAVANPLLSLSAFYEGCETPPYKELEGSADPALTEGIFYETAEKYRLGNAYVRIEASDDVASLEPFHQSRLEIAEGRFPAAGEKGACVVDGTMAMQMGLKLGDRVDAALTTSGLDDRFDLAMTEETRQLTVVGITNRNTDYYGYLWVSKAEGGFPSALYGYLLGRAVVDNRAAVETAARLSELAPEQVRVTLYDQGYADAARPLEDMREAAVGVTVGALCSVLTVLVLFGYLFIARQRDTVELLESLGTPVGKIRVWLLSGCVLIVGVAALLGGGVGALLLGQIITLVLSAIRGTYQADVRYSEGAAEMSRQITDVGWMPPWLIPAVVLLVFVAALAFCLVFLRLVLEPPVKRERRVSGRVPKAKVRTMGTGALRFAQLSARRGGWRSGTVLVTACILSLFLGLLSSGAGERGGQLTALYENTRIEGQVVSLSGREYSDLALNARNARLLWNSGLLDDVSVSVGWNYWQPERMPEFLSQGAKNGWIKKQPEVIALNRLSAAPEFYYSQREELQWLDGWDESCLAGADYQTILYQTAQKTEGQPYPALVSQAFLKDCGLALGDSLTVTVRVPYRRSTMDVSAQLLVVGTFAPQGSKDHIYVPLGFWFSPEWLTGAVDVLTDVKMPNSITSWTGEEWNDFAKATTTFRTCRFTLATAHGLGDFRDYLAAQEFSAVGAMGRNRTTIKLIDQSFLEAVGGVNRYLYFVQILYPALMAVVGLLGFVISWLMVNGRKQEFYIMREMGASKGRVFRSFFWEQAGLSLAGSVVGAALLQLIMALTGSPAAPAAWLGAGGFLLCYLLGCAVSIALAGRLEMMQRVQEG